MPDNGQMDAKDRRIFELTLAVGEQVLTIRQLLDWKRQAEERIAQLMAGPAQTEAPEFKADA